MSSLDKIFCCRQIEIDQAHVVRTKLARDASDHLPLVFDFRINRAASVIEAAHQVEPGSRHPRARLA
jgi:hypothetical protein